MSDHSVNFQTFALVSKQMNVSVFQLENLAAIGGIVVIVIHTLLLWAHHASWNPIFEMLHFRIQVGSIKFGKLLDVKEVIEGRNAGSAITFAQFSVATCQAVLCNVVITHDITPKRELVRVDRLDFREMGTFAPALNTEGVDTIIIPEANVLSVPDEDRDFEIPVLSIAGVTDFWDFARNSRISSRQENSSKISHR